MHSLQALPISGANSSPPLEFIRPVPPTPASAAPHAGQEPEKLTGAVVVPIYQTSTYAQPEQTEDEVDLLAHLEQ